LPNACQGKTTRGKHDGKRGKGKKRQLSPPDGAFSNKDRTINLLKKRRETCRSEGEERVFRGVPGEKVSGRTREKKNGGTSGAIDTNLYATRTKKTRNRWKRGKL